MPSEAAARAQRERGVPETGAAGSCRPGPTGSQQPRRARGVGPPAWTPGPPSGGPGLGLGCLHRPSKASAAEKVICRQRDWALGAWV